jgi:NAD+ synthase (glutamine-hydrolysing)
LKEVLLNPSLFTDPISLSHWRAPLCSLFGKLRKVWRCGPVSFFQKARRVLTYDSAAAVAAKVKHFFTCYAKSRHKVSSLTPGLHVGAFEH